MPLSQNWMNSNTARPYPVDARFACPFPDNLISDMQVLVQLPRNTDIDSNAYPLLVRELASFTSLCPKIHSVALTKYMATVVVKCPDCMLFCTKPIADIIPYEPVEFVSSTGACSGWLSFGDLTGIDPFAFACSGNQGFLDPRAVVFLPSSSIGGLEVPSFSGKLVGGVKIAGGGGISVSADKETNSIVLSLSDPAIYADPCSPGSDMTPICNVSGVSPENGSVILAFTEEPLSQEGAVSLKANIQARNIGASDVSLFSPYGVQQNAFVREPDSEGGFMDWVSVCVQPSVDITILNYRLVYAISDPENFDLLARDMEFSIGTGYHRPQYDVWTDRRFLPKLAELYRGITVGSGDCPAPDAPWDLPQYAPCHMEASRYAPSDSDPDVGDVIPCSSGDGCSGSPYSVSSIVCSSSQYVNFRHGIHSAIPADRIDSVFVEVEYILSSASRPGIIRRELVPQAALQQE